jgi:hypothetical protein
VIVNNLPLCIDQVIGFGSRHAELFEGKEFVAYSEDTKAIALHHAESLRADMGGTEILKPITHISKYARSELPRNVIIITGVSPRLHI